MLRSKKQKTGCTGLVESWREDLARRLTQCTSKMIRQLADMCQQAREREKRSREDEEQEEDEHEEEDERTEDVCRRRWSSTSFCAEMRKPLLRQSPLYQQRRGRGGREGRRHIISIKHTEGGGLKMATGGKKEEKKRRQEMTDGVLLGRCQFRAVGHGRLSITHRCGASCRLHPPPVKRENLRVCVCVCEGDGGGRLAQGCVEASAPDLPASFFVKYPPESEPTQSHCCSTDEPRQSHRAQ